MTAVANRVTRWCPRHEDEMVKRGTLRCRRCTSDLQMTKRRRLSIPSDQLKPMRAKGTPTKRATERRIKGYVS